MKTGQTDIFVHICISMDNYFYIVRHNTNFRFTHTPLTLYLRRGSRKHYRYFSKTPTLYQNYSAMRNTAEVTGGNFIAV
jgi:hypothetical protein